MTNVASPPARAGTIVGRDLVVDYQTERGSLRALACDHLHVDAGCSLAIMGSSGSGKSTLLGLIAGLAAPTRGVMTVGDVTVSALTEVHRVSFRREHVGMVYQSDNLLAYLTVEENIGLQQAICRRPEKTTSGVECEPLVEELLDRLGIGSLARRLPDQLSGGQRQRVAVARAVIHRPAVILADEPTGALDDVNARIVIELLVEVQRHIGATLIVVTHDSFIASHLDRTMVLAREAEFSA